MIKKNADYTHIQVTRTWNRMASYQHTYTDQDRPPNEWVSGLVPEHAHCVPSLCKISQMSPMHKCIAAQTSGGTWLGMLCTSFICLLTLLSVVFVVRFGEVCSHVVAVLFKVDACVRIVIVGMQCSFEV